MKFQFIACPENKTYHYDITRPGSPRPISVVKGSASPCPPNTFVTTTGDCAQCSAPNAGCSITVPTINVADLNGANTLTLNIYDEDNNVIATTTICVPDSSNQKVFLGDCITTQLPSGAPGCNLTPTLSNIVLVIDPDNIPLPEQQDALKVLIVRIFKCDQLVLLTTEELSLLLEFGLHYQISLNGCCGCILVKNTIRLVSGAESVNGFLPVLSADCLTKTHAVSVTETTSDTVNLPPCKIQVKSDDVKILQGMKRYNIRK